MQDSNHSESILKLVKVTERETLVDERLYRSLVGSRLYIAEQTRPDIVCVVNVLSQFMDKPTNTHWLAAKRELRYLQATKSPKLVYPRDNDFHLHGENDADCSQDLDDRQSPTGYFLKTTKAASNWRTTP